MRILKFNEAIDFSIHHTIKDEDILDISLEMTDIGYGINIRRFFVNDDDSITDEPISKIALPIYQIDFLIDYDSEGEGYRYDGSYHYNDIEHIKAFTSVLSKMKKLLPVKDAIYASSNSRLSIRLILEKVEIEELGFDWYSFNEDASKLFKNMENAGTIEIIESWSGGASMKHLQILAHRLKDKEYLNSQFEKTDIFDNKSQYREIISNIENFLKSYSKFVNCEWHFEKHQEYGRKVKTGLFSSKEQEYVLYRLDIVFRKKGSS